MVGATILLTLFFAGILSAIALAVYHGKIFLTSGRLTASPLGRLLSWGYPLLLLVALAAYYTLPFDRLYHAEESLSPRSSDASAYSPDTTHNAELETMVRQSLQADRTAAWASNELFQSQATLAYDGKTLDLRVPTTAYLLVSEHPADEGTISLHYFPGQLNIAGYQADTFIKPQVTDFMLDDLGHLTVKGFESDQLEMQTLSFLLWQTDGPMAQFPLDTTSNYHNFYTTCDSALVVQVPADTTVTYYGDPITKGKLI